MDRKGTMNRGQRRSGRISKHALELKMKMSPAELLVQQILSPKTVARQPSPSIASTNRCCHAMPEHKDFEQLANFIWEDDSLADAEQYENLLMQQYGFHLPKPLVKGLDRVVFAEIPTANDSCQCLESRPEVANTSTDTQDAEWVNVHDEHDVDQYILQNQKAQHKDETPRQIHISEVPNIKIIAERFSKYKKNNIELRKLEEKLVCVEYSVYDGENLESSEPLQTMRAFFSIKPVVTKAIPSLPSVVKKKFSVTSHDFGKLNEREIEIIDGSLQANKPYLDDLKTVLNRAKIFSTSNKLDLQTMYEIALRHEPTLQGDSSFLSKAGLEEIKELILSKCASSVHGISRKTFKTNKLNEADGKMTAVSDCIVAELLKD